MKSQIHWNQDLLIFLLLFCFDSKTWFQWDSGFFLTATYPSCNDGLATSHNSMMPGTWHLQNKYEPFPQSSQLWLFTLRFPRLVLSTESLKNSLAAELIIWLVQLFLEKKKKKYVKRTETSCKGASLPIQVLLWMILSCTYGFGLFLLTYRRLRPLQALWDWKTVFFLLRLLMNFLLLSHSPCMWLAYIFFPETCKRKHLQNNFSRLFESHNFFLCRAYKMWEIS